MNCDEYLPTRQSLVNRLKNLDDQASWQDFFNTYWRFIYGVALKAGLTEVEAQDVVQETIMTVARKINDFQVGSERGSFKAWLTHTTKWRIADQIRKRSPVSRAAVHRTPEDTAITGTTERVPDPASLDPDEAWEHDWEQNLLEVALEKIKQRVDADEFQLFHLHIIKQWPAKKVIATTGAKLAQIYFAKYKITRLLKNEIARLRKEIIISRPDPFDHT